MAHRITGRLLFYTMMIITVMYTAVVLATFKGARDRAFSRIGALYTAAFKTPEKTTVTRVEIHEKKIVQAPIPAPPPPKIISAPSLTLKPGQPKPVPMRSPKEVEDVVTESREEVPSPRAAKKPEAAESEPAPPVVAKGQEQEAAYRNLLAGSKSMAELVNRSDPKLKFKGWSTVKSSGDEHWIDVVFQNTAENSEVHYTWSVNNVSKKIVPLNHFAKRLAGR